MGSALNQTRTTVRLVSWCLVIHQHPYAPNAKPLRVHATYSDGSVRMLPASFTDRAHVDKYLSRYHADSWAKRLTHPRVDQHNLQPLPSRLRIFPLWMRKAGEKAASI